MGNRFFCVQTCHNISYYLFTISFLKGIIYSSTSIFYLKYYKFHHLCLFPYVTFHYTLLKSQVFFLTLTRRWGRRIIKTFLISSLKEGLYAYHFTCSYSMYNL